MITSHANERVKAIRRLADRKARDESGLFWVEGLRLVGEAFDCGAAVQTLVVAPDLLRSDFGHGLVARARHQTVEVLEVSAEVFARLSQKDGPQGIAACVRPNWTRLDDAVVEPNCPWVALEAVADPGNLGTILRTGDSAGAAGVILLDHSTDPYDPSAVRGSMGAVFAQRLVRTSLTELDAWRRRQGAALIGTSDRGAQDYHAFRYPERSVILMGSERHGLSAQAVDRCDTVVRIPMLGRSDSLNLAVATAVLLYEMVNQRREAI